MRCEASCYPVQKQTDSLEMVCLYYTAYQHELAVLFRALKTIISFQGVPSKLPAQLVCFAEIILVCWRKFPGRKVSVYEFPKYVLMFGTCIFCSDPTGLMLC